ncbi:MAG: VanZ family protein [Bdellovibrionota bacterium]
MSLYSKTWFRAISWLLVAAYMGLIFWLSSLSVLPVAMPFPYEDKFVHTAAYAILGFLAANAFSQGSHKRRFWLAFVLASLYGITDEAHQYFVPGRDCSIWDWCADVTGAWLGAYLYLKSEPAWRKGPSDPLPR